MVGLPYLSSAELGCQGVCENLAGIFFFSDAVLVCLGDTFMSVLAGFSMFAMLGVLSHELGTDIEHVIQSGKFYYN